MSWGAGCAQAGRPAVFTRLDVYHAWIEAAGYCGCINSGGADLPPPGCTHAILQAERDAGTLLNTAADSDAACYVLDPQRCSTAVASRLFGGGADAALVPCDSSTHLAAGAAAEAQDSGGGLAVEAAAAAGPADVARRAFVQHRG